jgi:hypothetical protein
VPRSCQPELAEVKKIGFAPADAGCTITIANTDEDELITLPPTRPIQFLLPEATAAVMSWV